MVHPVSGPTDASMPEAVIPVFDEVGSEEIDGEVKESESGMKGQPNCSEAGTQGETGMIQQPRDTEGIEENHIPRQASQLDHEENQIRYGRSIRIEKMVKRGVLPARLAELRQKQDGNHAE